MNIRFNKTMTARLGILTLSAPIYIYFYGPYKHEIKTAILALSIFLLFLTFTLEEGEKKASLKVCILTGLITSSFGTYLITYIPRHL